MLPARIWPADQNPALQAESGDAGVGAQVGLLVVQALVQVDSTHQRFPLSAGPDPDRRRGSRDGCGSTAQPFPEEQDQTIGEQERGGGHGFAQHSPEPGRNWPPGGPPAMQAVWPTTPARQS